MGVVCMGAVGATAPTEIYVAPSIPMVFTFIFYILSEIIVLNVIIFPKIRQSFIV